MKDNPDSKLVEKMLSVKADLRLILRKDGKEIVAVIGKRRQLPMAA